MKGLWIVGIALIAMGNQAAEIRQIDPTIYHLGQRGNPEWQEFAGKTPHGSNLTVRFHAQPNRVENTLLIKQDNVKWDWGVTLNGQKLGKLFLMESPLWHTFALPPGALKAGENILAIIPPKEQDDILVGPFQLAAASLSQLLGESTLEVSVVAEEKRDPLPCRITITEMDGTLAPLSVATDINVATRPGVVYTLSGHAKISMRPGAYVVYVSRGFEYSLATNVVTLRPRTAEKLSFQLRREVSTEGWVSSDTHIHTFTYARHGDATLQERLVTLAGEGIELPISTEHNQLIDFNKSLGAAAKFMTPVIGCEVTTKRGHFNVFPIRAGSEPPDESLLEWPKLMESIRATPEAKVAILNHPRDVHSGFCPFAETNLISVTGENRRGFEFTFDAVELINSGALRSDLMQAYHDWFGLLNYGYRLTAVGASDSHDVTRFIVGQGRTYIRARDDDPSRIPVNEACDNVLKGRALVSLGLLCNMQVQTSFQVGDLATNLPAELAIQIQVLRPSWISAERIEIYANGQKVLEQRLNAQASSGRDEINLRWPKPKHDVHLVAIAWGPGILSPHWTTPRPYQNSSPVWTPHVFASTNPIWIDADGDGNFTAARAYAQELVRKHQSNPEGLLAALANYDAAVAAQVASVLTKSGKNLDALADTLTKSAESVRKGFTAYIEATRK